MRRTANIFTAGAAHDEVVAAGLLAADTPLRGRPPAGLCAVGVSCRYAAWEPRVGTSSGASLPLGPKFTRSAALDTKSRGFTPEDMCMAARTPEAAVGAASRHHGTERQAFRPALPVRTRRGQAIRKSRAEHWTGCLGAQAPREMRHHPDRDKDAGKTVAHLAGHLARAAPRLGPALERKSQASARLPRPGES